MEIQVVKNIGEKNVVGIKRKKKKKIIKNGDSSS